MGGDSLLGEARGVGLRFLAHALEAGYPSWGFAGSELSKAQRAVREFSGSYYKREAAPSPLPSFLSETGIHCSCC